MSSSPEPGPFHHNPSSPAVVLPGPTFLIELGAPGAEAVIFRPLGVPILARSCPTALTAHTGRADLEEGSRVRSKLDIRLKQADR